MAKSLRWEKSPEQVFIPGFARYQADVVAELQSIALYFQPLIESFLKETAPWTDRSGNARQSLFAEVEELILGARIIMDYGVDYGLFLELSMQSRWAVIAPALDHWGPIIWAEVKRRFS